MKHTKQESPKGKSSKPIPVIDKEVNKLAKLDESCLRAPSLKIKPPKVDYSTMPKEFTFFKEWTEGLKNVLVEKTDESKSSTEFFDYQNKTQ